LKGIVRRNGWDTVIQNGQRMSWKPNLRIAAVIGVALLGMTVSGCGISNITSGLGGGMFGGRSDQTQAGSVTKEDLLQAAKADFQPGGPTGNIKVAHGCPRFLAWSRENSLTVYDKGQTGDSLAVLHRGEITQTARECNIAPGRVTVKYGFSGRVLLGPRGKAGRVTLPVEVFVMDAARQRITADKLVINVDVSLDKPIGYFSKVQTLTFAIPEGTRPGEYEVFVGFEQAVPRAG
jgi:hypothetical protein